MVLVFIALGSTLTASGAFRPQAGRFGGHAGGVDGAWILQRLHPFAQDVGSVVPAGFEAYARIFHPAASPDGPMRWSEVAGRFGRTVHPRMQFDNISDGAWPWDDRPADGTLTLADAAALAEVLRPHTVSPAACCFAVWEGYGSLPDSVRGLPDLAVPQRRMLVREGPLDSVVESVFEPPWGYQSPNLWWPADQAWCVASEIDFNTTYVGGARACIADVLAAPGIEALATVVEAPIDFTSDEVNPRPR
jgi:hypothetical protein